RTGGACCRPVIIARAPEAPEAPRSPSRNDLPGLADRHEVELIRAKSPGLAIGREPPRRFVHGLVRQVIESAPMHAYGARRAEVLAYLQGLGHVDVHRSHEPARRVGAYGDEGEVEGTEALADVARVLRVPQVSGVDDPHPAAFHHPAAPQRLV